MISIAESTKEDLISGFPPARIFNNHTYTYNIVCSNIMEDTLNDIDNMDDNVLDGGSSAIVAELNIMMNKSIFKTVFGNFLYILIQPQLELQFRALTIKRILDEQAEKQEAEEKEVSNILSSLDQELKFGPMKIWGKSMLNDFSLS